MSLKRVHARLRRAMAKSGTAAPHVATLMRTTAVPRGDRMKRREFITLFGGAASSLAWPCGGQAQQAGKVSHIGVLRVGPPPPSFIGPLRKALAALGHVE